MKDRYYLQRLYEFMTLWPPRQRLPDFLEPPYMDALILRELRVKAGAKDISLSDSNDIPSLISSADLCAARNGFLQPPRKNAHDLNTSPHGSLSGGVLRSSRRSYHSPAHPTLVQLLALNTGKDLLDHRSSNENTRVPRGSILQELQVELSLETFRLPAEMITVDTDIKTPDQFLPALLGGVGGF
jgi:hypothetical protein